MLMPSYMSSTDLSVPLDPIITEAFGGTKFGSNTTVLCMLISTPNFHCLQCLSKNDSEA